MEPDKVIPIGLPENPAGVRLDDPDLTPDDLAKAVDHLTEE
jgi:hypothetical protein